jgi:signal transduction histidine kinase
VNQEAANEAISALAHELKTPVAAISGFAELLAARDDEKTRREATAQIQRAADRLTAAVDGLLEVLISNPELAVRLAAARGLVPEAQE